MSEPETTAEKEKPKAVDGVETVLKEIGALPTNEEKIVAAIDYMEKSLSQSGTPQFRHFWEVRKLCGDLFKETLPPGLRAEQWKRYTELSTEARRLKDLLDEQSRFAVEQIEIAIHAVEEELKQYQTLLSKQSEVTLPKYKAIQKHRETYCSCQTELTLLNTLAVRINSLRKELINTPMRIKQKNQFFQRLSSLGDHVFPKRKDLIMEVSTCFLEDIEAFEKDHFSRGVADASGRHLRDEIKHLQIIAKQLTLNTKTFSTTRKILSSCWDRLKELDKERKKEFAEKKQVFEENAKPLFLLIQEIVEGIEQNTLTLAQADRKLGEVEGTMRKTELGHEEVRALRGAVQKARMPILEKQKAEAQQRIDEQKQKEQQRQAAFEEVKKRLGTMEKELESLTLEKIDGEWEEIQAQITTLGCTKAERQELDFLFVPLSDAIANKKEGLLLAETPDVKQLKEVLKIRRKRQAQVKKQLEELRKAAGSSGLDFEQAMNQTELIQLEKERLETITAAVEALEQEIAKKGKAAKTP